MDVYGISDIGLVRPANQDRFVIVPHRLGQFRQSGLMAVVCDGIGGAKAGEVASEQTIRILEQAFLKVSSFASVNELEGWMYQQIRKVNDTIFSMAITDPKYTGMGTTLVGAVLYDKYCRIAHVGDSRAYCLRHGSFECLTEDHTFMNELLRQGELTVEEAMTHPKRNYLTNAIGVFNQIRIDMIALDDGFDVLMLCSDGLYGMVSANRIQTILRQPWSAKEKCELLVKVAKQYGGIDNITVVIIQKEVVS